MAEKRCVEVMLMSALLAVLVSCGPVNKSGDDSGDPRDTGAVFTVKAEYIDVYREPDIHSEIAGRAYKDQRLQQMEAKELEHLSAPWIKVVTDDGVEGYVLNTRSEF